MAILIEYNSADSIEKYERRDMHRDVGVFMDNSATRLVSRF